MKKALILLILLLVSIGLIVMIRWRVLQTTIETIPNRDFADRPEVSVSDMTVTDYDGNTYNVAKIGNQFWMKENFRGTHYADGSLISGHGDPNTTPPAAYPEAPTVEGLLYNWDDATYKTLITGWHIPTDAEWKRLEMYLGMTREEANARGKRMGTGKRGGGVAAELTEIMGTSGFDALYAGLRTDDGIYGVRETGTVFWTDTEDGSGKAWYRSFGFPPMNLFRDSRPKGWAFSVRCLED